MWSKWKKLWIWLVLALFVSSVVSCATANTQTAEASIWQTIQSSETESAEPEIAEDGEYTTKEEVALYIHEFGHLPGNYITKNHAKKMGWDSRAGNLDEVAPGKSIGGSSFGNYEGQLPDAKNRKYYECDLNYEGGYRGSERIIYSNDGLIFYTGDHYKTFEQLY